MTPTPANDFGGAPATVFSPDRVYRYTLWRAFGDATKKYAMFIGLNPSTADETRDDPTIRRCIRFAKSWGYEALCMTNLFAFRATDPRIMKGCGNPIGPENDMWLTRCARNAGVIIAAWGVHGQHMGRDEDVLKLLDNVECLRLTKGGFPSHPLYLPAGLSPVPLSRGHNSGRAITAATHTPTHWARD